MKKNNVIKFGGTSVSTAKMMKQALAITKNAYEKDQVTVVVSALGGITNQLIEVAKLAKANATQLESAFLAIKERHKTQFSEVCQLDFSVELEPLFAQFWATLQRIQKAKRLKDKDLDEVMSYGERFSVRMFSAGLNEIGVPSVYRETHQIIKTDSTFGDAVVDLELSASNLKKSVLNVEGVVVFTGFIASNAKGEITTLGRSGSDFTAGLVGYSLDADCVEIWTDVDGVFTTDPNLVKTARLLPELTYDFMELMADNGAKVLHPRTVRPLQLKKIPILIKNTFNPSAPGTLVTVHQTEKNQDVTTAGLKKNLAFIPVVVFDEIKPNLEESLYIYLEQKMIHIQQGDKVAGLGLHKSDVYFQEFYDFIKSNENMYVVDAAQITLITTGIFSHKQIESLLHLLKEKSIRTLGFSIEKTNLISIFVEEHDQQLGLEMLHNVFC